MMLLFWLLFFVSAAALLTALLTHLFFLYEFGNGTSDDMVREPLGVSLPRAVARGVVSSFLAQLGVYCTFPLGMAPRLFFPNSRPYGSQTVRPPILLVHGLYHNPAAWFVHSLRLHRAGYPVYVYGYNSWTRNYFQARLGLARRVDAVRALTGADQIILMGHSLGGLLIRGFMNLPESRGKVLAACTLGSPHQGSKLAVLGAGVLARSLRFRGDIIHALEAESQRPDAPQDAPGLALYSPVDNFVLPRQGLHIHLKNWRMQRISPISHVAMLFHPEPMQHALNFFKEVHEEHLAGMRN